MASDGKMLLLHLPSEILSHIISYLSYDQISCARVVCKQFDAVCQQLLSQGFCKVDKYHTQVQKQVKAQLPRRESERRSHQLARHVDILSAIETRLSLLSMTYMKYVSSGVCCFIPGKVIDEIYNVLKFLKENKNPPHSHELLRELRDISSMAMEHFDEKIAPRLKANNKNTQSMSEPRPGTSKDMSAPPTPQMRLPSLRKDIMQLQHQVRACVTSLVASKKEVTDFRKKMIEQNSKIQDQNKKIVEQNRLIAEQTGKIGEQDRRLNDLSKKLNEANQRFMDFVGAEKTLSIVVDNNVKMNIDGSSVSENPLILGKNTGIIDSLVDSEKKPVQVEDLCPTALLVDTETSSNGKQKQSRAGRKRKIVVATSTDAPVARRTRARQTVS